jgi:hypothetical protein
MSTARPSRALAGERRTARRHGRLRAKTARPRTRGRCPGIRQLIDAEPLD